MNSVERLSHDKLAEEGLYPPLEAEEAKSFPDPEKPEQVISTYFYGEHLHWDKDKAPLIVERGQDPFNDGRFKLFFLQAASGLAHFYIGYSLLVRAALARQP